jgi:hypothetical protein
MGSSAATGLSPEALFTECEAFPMAFASFLRRNQEAWRVRRIDRFCPSDLHLAEHRVTLQGRIDPSLLDRFVELEAEDLGLELDRSRLHHGAPLKIYLPAIAHPKRLLLDFSIRNEQNHAVPMLGRFESARVTAVHLAAIAARNQLGENKEDARALLAALVALAFHDPLGLAQRISRWVPKWNKEKPESYPPARWVENEPLARAHLLAWVEREAEAFLPGLGALLKNAVEEYLRLNGDGAPALQPYIPPLAHYSTVPQLFFHAIRAVLKTCVGLAPLMESEQTSWPTRRRLMNDPELLGSEFKSGPLRGLDVLTEVLANNGTAAMEELCNDLAYWTSYVPLEIELGIPFLLKFSEMTPVTREVTQLRLHQRIVATATSKHWYMIPERDAEAVHIEIRIPDPVLRLDCPPRIVASRGLGIRPRTKEVPLDWIFGGLYHPSERLVHLYSTRMRQEKVPDPVLEPRGARARVVGAGRDLSKRCADFYSAHVRRNGLPDDPTREKSYEKLRPYLRLEVKFRLVRTVAFGHALAVVASVLAAAYIVGTAGRAGWTRTALKTDDFRIVATVGALAITVSLWLTNIGHPRPLAFKKLEIARILLSVSLLTVVAALAFYAIRVGLKL